MPGWPIQLNTTDWVYGRNSPAVGDINGDGTLEIAIPPSWNPSALDECNVIHLFRYTGQPVEGWPVRIPTPDSCDDMDAIQSLSVSIGDVDGDGKAEVLFAGRGMNYYSVADGLLEKLGGIWAWQGSGELLDLNGSLPGYALMMEATGWMSGANPRPPPSIVDIDNDGQVELVNVSQNDADMLRGFKERDSLYVWDLPVPYHPATMLWPEYQHDSQLTGRLPPSLTCGNGTIDQGEVCDDGGTVDSDGCSATCQIEDGWTCVEEPSVCQSDLQIEVRQLIGIGQRDVPTPLQRLQFFKAMFTAKDAQDLSFDVDHTGTVNSLDFQKIIVALEAILAAPQH
jgi:cysteine-rich repeat protein